MKKINERNLINEGNNIITDTIDLVIPEIVSNYFTDIVEECEKNPDYEYLRLEINMYTGKFLDLWLDSKQDLENYFLTLEKNKMSTGDMFDIINDKGGYMSQNEKYILFYKIVNFMKIGFSKIGELDKRIKNWEMKNLYKTTLKTQN